MAKYQMMISFDTDKVLSSEEEDNIIGHVAPQIEEPITSEGDDEEYSTSNLQISLSQNMTFGKMTVKEAMEILTTKHYLDDYVLFYVEAVQLRKEIK
jgi:hypothetical protein